MYTKGQAQHRRMDFFRDQHGRAWKANIEITTGDPCEGLMPDGWTAPAGPHWMRGALLPPEDCRDMVPIQERNLRGFQVRINYQRWLNQWDAANESYTRKLHDFAMGMAAGANVEALVQNPSPALRQIVGDPPSPPRAFIEACAAGDPWSLGLSEQMPAKAEPLVAAMKPLITERRRTADQAVNPFEDDESPVAAAVEAFAPLVPNPFADDEAASVKPRRAGKSA